MTKKVAALVKSGVLAIEASNENFGDPANGHTKQLRVDYSVNGVKASKTVPEQETLTFTATSTPPAIVEAICGAVRRGPRRGQAGPAALAANGRRAQGPADGSSRHGRQRCPSEGRRLAHRVRLAHARRAASDHRPGRRRRRRKTIKILALRGLVRLVPQDNSPDAKKFDALKRAMALADRDEERQLVLSALGNVATADSLALVASYLDNPALKEEACLAAVTIAEKIASRDARLAAVMKQVAKVTANKELAARANAIARRAKK